MKFLFETMRFLSKYIALNQQIIYLMTFHTYFTAFQTSAPTRITEQIGKMPQIAETKTVSAIFAIPLSGKITHIVGFSSEQFVNNHRREQFCSRFREADCNSLNFCVFLRFTVLKVGLSYTLAGSKPHFSDNLS